MNLLIKMGKQIAKHKFLILLIGFLLLIPSLIGMVTTRVNYDLLSYLPETLETVKGQDIMVDEYGMGAFSMVVVENMELKDVQKLEKKFEAVDHVKDVLWYDDVADLNLPVQMIPKKLREGFFKGNATMMIVLFDNTTSSDESMNAVAEMRKLANKQCFISGMSGVVNDIKDVALDELPVYVVIAAVLSFLVLEFTTESFLVPVFFLLSIGIAIIYNLGSNVFLGQVSYITKALTAVLQLGVTMDYSIFLLNSYEEYKEKYTEDRNRAMGHAIASTFKAVVGSSVTTVAGFAALCFMTFALGRDLGIVMAKGVIIGVICCVTILPSLILAFDKQIEKTKHRPLIKSVDGASNFIIKHHWVWLIVFLVLLLPAVHGNNNIKIYYDIAKSMPSSLPSNVATDRLKKDFNMSTIHMVMMDSNMDSKDKRDMLKEIDNVEGVKWTISMSSLVGASVPESMIPKDVKSMLQSGDHELAFICSEYESATPKVNKQIAKINKITKNYDKTSMVIGEAPLMKDLEDVTNIDIQNVNIASIAAIFVIILIITIIAINTIWKKDNKSESNKNTNSMSKQLAVSNQTVNENVNTVNNDIEEKLKNILSKIQGVGNVDVLITYSRTSQIVPLYNEDLTESTTEETDKEGGTRKINENSTKKDIIYQEDNGEKTPITREYSKSKDRRSNNYS